MTQKYFHLPDYATAPIQQGDVVGTVELKLAGETIGVVNLIAGQDVHQNALLFTVSKVQAFFHSLYLKVVIVLSCSLWRSTACGCSSTCGTGADRTERSIEDNKKQPSQSMPDGFD